MIFQMVLSLIGLLGNGFVGVAGRYLLGLAAVSSAWGWRWRAEEDRN